jgi:hypothetical protein
MGSIIGSGVSVHALYRLVNGDRGVGLLKRQLLY